MKTMETMKLIDLLNKIANGEKTPKKILFDDLVFYLINSEKDFYNNIHGYLLNKVSLNKKYLNKEIIILEE